MATTGGGPAGRFTLNFSRGASPADLGEYRGDVVFRAFSAKLDLRPDTTTPARRHWCATFETQRGQYWTVQLDRTVGLPPEITMDQHDALTETDDTVKARAGFWSVPLVTPYEIEDNVTLGMVAQYCLEHKTDRLIDVDEEDIFTRDLLRTFVKNFPASTAPKTTAEVAVEEAGEGMQVEEGGEERGGGTFKGEQPTTTTSTSTHTPFTATQQPFASDQPQQQQQPQGTPFNLPFSLPTTTTTTTQPPQSLLPNITPPLPLPQTLPPGTVYATTTVTTITSISGPTPTEAGAAPAQPSLFSVTPGGPGPMGQGGATGLAGAAGQPQQWPTA